MRLFITILIFIAVLGAIVFFSMPALKEIRRSRAIENEIESLREEADKISADNGFLREQVDYLKSDHYKERLAKDKLNLRNPGEQVVIVQPSVRKDDVEENSGKEIENENDSAERNTSNFQKWWSYFFN